jgi:MFS family permease
MSPYEKKAPRFWTTSNFVARSSTSPAFEMPSLNMMSNSAANALVPQAEAGKYLGLTNLATAGAGALARLEGPILDWLNQLWPGLWAGYKGLFLFGGIAIFLSLFILRKIEVKPRENSKELHGEYPTTL